MIITKWWLHTSEWREKGHLMEQFVYGHMHCVCLCVCVYVCVFH